MKNKSTKHALLASVLSIVMCFAMLIGSTFAWFTDEVKSGMNKIVAGNLDVELYNTKDGEPVTAETKLFKGKDGNDILWEPGVMVYEKLTVKNAGSLALKYRLTLNSNFTVVDGKSLEDVLKVAIVSGEDVNKVGEDRATTLANLNFIKFSEAEQTGVLAAGADGDTYAIVIYWEPSDRDNDYNIAGGVLSVDLGVNLVATQAASENDSFDNNYDENAASEQNLNMLKLCSQGYKAIKSLDDLTYTLTEDNGEKVAFISNTGKFVLDVDLPKDTDWVFNSSSAPIVIDLNGHTAKNCFYVEDGADLTITDSYGNGKTGFEIAVFDGNLTIDGGTHGNVGALGGNLTINGGSCSLVIGESGSSGTNNYADGDIIINGGTITNFYINEWTNKVTINGGKFPAYGGFARPLPYGRKDIIDIYGGLFQKVSLNDLADYVRGDSVITEITDEKNTTWYKVTSSQS